MSSGDISLESYRGQRFVVKVGGEILDTPDTARAFADNLLMLHGAGIKVVLCHGGGPQLSRMMQASDVTPEFVDGHRVTTEETLRLTKMVFLGEVNKGLVSLLNSEAAFAIGLSGFDARLLEVIPRDTRLGYVGDIESVNADLIDLLLKHQYIPVIAPLGIGANGQIYNINADSVAGEVCCAVGGSKIFLLTNVAGLYGSLEDPDSLIANARLAELEHMLQDGSLVAGMIPKAESIIRVLKHGAESAHIIDGRDPTTLFKSLSSTHGCGTTFTL